MRKKVNVDDGSVEANILVNISGSIGPENLKGQLEGILRGYVAIHGHTFVRAEVSGDAVIVSFTRDSGGPKTVDALAPIKQTVAIGMHIPKGKRDSAISLTIV